MGQNEKTLVFIKPHNEDIAYQALDYLNLLLNRDKLPFDKFGLNWELRSVSECLISEHYNKLRIINEDIFRATIDAYKTGTMFLTFYSGEDIIERVRRSIGSTDPQKAEDWTVRGHFRRDSLEEALREKRYLNNVIHASSDASDAERELSLWMPFLDRTL